MPEQITQKLGFDASAAITSLTNLNQKLGEFRQGLQATSGGLRKFEKNAVTAVATFNTLGTAATKAATGLAQLRIASGGAVPPQIAAQSAAASAAMSNLGTSAVTAKAKLSGVGTGAAASAAAMGKLTASATTAAASVRSSSASMATAANKTTAALNKTGKAGAEAAKTIGISWKTIGRIILAQGVIRGLSLLVSTFNDAQEAAREFSLRVGEISTIAGGALGSINDISAATLELSRNLGIATDEVAEGLYQTLSNQVVEAGDAIRFETTAAKLSITTHSQLKESINALSSVMNSYQLDVSEVEEVSAVLFKTIELGRLRMGEFGDVLGRVSPLTAALGISYKEMAASLAAITQKGVPAHTAITQLTAVTQKLLRPTDKLQELYEKWGVETGPEAIRRFGGLRGVLLKMREATRGNEKDFAALFGRVRSMVGGMNLTTESAKALTHALSEMEDPTDDLDAAFGRMESTIGRRSVKAWDDLDVSIHQAGATFLEVTTPMVEIMATMARNSDITLAALAGLGIGALVVSGKLAVAGAALLGLNTKLLLLRATMLTILPVVIAVAAAIAIMQIKKAFINSVDSASAAFNRLKEHQERLTKETEKASKKRIDAMRAEVRERQALTNEFIVNEEKLLRQGNQLFAISSKAVAGVLGDTLTRLTTQRQEAIKTVRDAVTDMDGVIKDSLKVIKSTQEAIAEFDYQQGTKQLNEQQKLWSDLARNENKAAQAAQAYKDALLNEEDVVAARKLSLSAEAQARKNLAEAEKQGNVATVARAVAGVKKVLDQRLLAEGTVVAERKRLDTDANRLALKNAEELDKKLTQLTDEREKRLLPSEDGELKSPDTLKADLEVAERLEGEIKKVAKELSESLDFAKVLKVKGVGPDLVDGILTAFNDAEFRWDNAVESLEAELRSHTFTFNVVANLQGSDLQKAVEKEFGPTGPTDPAAQERFKQTSEKEVAKEAAAVESLKVASRESKSNLLSVKELLQPRIWGDIEKTAERIADRAKEWSFPDLKSFNTASDEAFFKMEKINESLAKATKEGRALTQEEHNQVNSFRDFIKAQEESGNLSGSRLALTKQATAQYKIQHDQLDKIVEQQKILDEQGNAAKEAKAHLGSLEATTRQQKKLGEEVDGVNNGIKDTKESAEQLPAAVDAGTTAFISEAEAARLVKNEVLGTLTAQQKLNQLKSQVQPAAPTTLQLPELPVAPVQERSDVIKAATEGTEPFIQGIENVKEAAEGVPNFGIRILNGVSQATSATRTLGAETIDVAGKLATTAGAANSVSESVLKSADYIAVADTSTDAWASGMDSVAVAANNVTLAMQAAARASTEAALAASLVSASGGNIGTAFHGGPAVNYRAAGGLASRGADTIPVMASPDEFFMNARSSRRFASELQAMNAGREPIFRDKGGSVTNVGDINVSVTQGETANATARQIASSLRRELRRGTSRL
jgi:TP901 family phage tail tape measure protein